MDKQYFAHDSAYIDAGCEIGAGTRIWHFSHVMPDSVLGQNCNLGQNVVVSPGCRIGNNVKIQAQSGIGRNVKDNEVLQGSPALAYADYNKSYVHFKNFPRWVKTISDIEKKLDGNS